MSSNLTLSILFKTLILTLLLLLAGLPANAAGEDDGLLVGGFGEGFGPDGSGTIKLEFKAAVYEAVTVQPDGGIVVAGRGPLGSFGWLGRFNPDGSLDTTFGFQGQITENVTAFDDVTIYPGRKIVAVGYFNDDFAVARYLSTGAPDTGFSGDGLATLDFDGGFDFAQAVAIQPDGKIVLGGIATNCDLIHCNDDDFGLARFNPDGTPDLSFDSDAKHAFDMGDKTEGVDTLVLEPDGRIVALGGTHRDDSSRIAMARFLPDGRFDNSLDDDGKFISNLDYQGNNEAVQPDGTIIVAYEKPIGPNRQMHLVRFQANGRLDTGFGSNGEVPLPPGPVASPNLGGNVLRLPNGNLLFAGNTGPNGDLIVANLTADGRPNPAFGNGLGYISLSFGDSESVIDLAVAPSGHILLLHRAASGYYLTRLQPNGRLDSGGGRALTNLSNRNDIVHDIAIQPDGKILVAGEQGAILNNRVASLLTLARYTADGRLDTGFAGGGVINAPEDVLGVGRAVAFDAQGRVLVAGQVAVNSSGSDLAFTLQRYEPDGRPAPFPAAPGGPVVTNLTGTVDDVAEMVVQPDGKIVLAGYAGFKNPPADFALVRYLDSGQLDPTFGNNGIALTDVDGQGSIDLPTALALQPDGKLLLVGSTTPKNGQGGTVLLRYLPNGQLDPAFGGGDGKLTLIRGASALVLQPDGKIITGGTALINGQRVFVVARYTAEGAPDSGFNGSGDAIADFFGVDALGMDVIVEPNGTIVITGCTQETVDRFAIARFLPNGQLDSRFSGDGKALFDMNSVENACANVLARDPATGDYVLAGSADLGPVDAQLALARIRPRREHDNPPPVAGPNQYTTKLNTSLTIPAPGVLDNDSAGEGQPLIAHLVTTTNNGTLQLESNGSFTYTPNPGFSGSDSFIYQAGDGVTLSEPVSVTITVGNNPNPNPGGFSVFLPLVVK